MTPASSKTQIIWLEDRIVNLEKRLKEVERLNKATQPDDDDLKNVRYKATYRYETKQPLTDKEIIETCATWVVDDIGSDEVIKIVRRTERAHGIGKKE
jgi:hypothetical protein